MGLTGFRSGSKADSGASDWRRFSSSHIIRLLVATFAFLSVPALTAQPTTGTPPDLTQGGKRDESHDWLLGPTGARGWMVFRHEDLTTASRQNPLTGGDQGPPA